MRTLCLPALLLLHLAVGWGPGDGFADEVSFVADGVPTGLRFVGAPWKTEAGTLTGGGTGNILYLDKQFGPGDFQIDVRLAIREVGNSAASLVINGSHFGFEGKGGEMFTEGEVFGRQNLGVPVVRDGEAFQLQARREGDEFTVAVDGKQVASGRLPGSRPVTIGLRPWRSTMAVTSLVVTGDLQSIPEPPPHTDLFTRGVGAYHTYRIPAIVVTKQGTLLAFCEGRKDGGGDAGDIDMLVIRSTDCGRTWSEPTIIWDDGKNTCGNPAPVVDQDTGVIWLPMTWNLGSDHERDIMAGTSEQPRHVYVTHSKDDGVTWAEPAKISDSVRQPHWRWYATGPGNAIQLTRGPHRGRLLVPANHSDHSDAELHPYRSHVFWSDDHGATWKLGGVQPGRTNESAVVELADGSVLQAMRSYHGENRRAMAVSRDGGQSWGELYLDEALDTPVCQANILRYSWPEDDARGNKSRVLFSSPQGSGRAKMTVWLSYDEGKTWPVSKLIYAGGSAYSNLVDLPNGKIGVLYEKDGYQTISLATFDLAWLETP